MRTCIAFCCAVLLSSASVSIVPGVAGDDAVAHDVTARRQLVVMLAREAAERASPARLSLHEDFASLGLSVRRTLIESGPAMNGPLRHGGTGATNPFDLDPSRVLLLEASDSTTAAIALRALQSDPAIEWVEPDRVRAMCVEPDFPADPLFRDTRQWGLYNSGAAGAYPGAPRADVHAPEAWAVTTGSDALRLALADTGIDPMHPEFLDASGRSRVVEGADITGASHSVADSLGHGTMVAGIMAARTGEGAHFDSLGMAGVCGGDGVTNAGCRIVPVRITEGTSHLASSFDIARAMLHALHAGARAMNLSFAGGGPSRLERLALYHVITRGCIVVAASGNRGFMQAQLPQYPAAYAADGLCISAGASDPYDRRARFSSYGPALDLIAPGQDIWSTWMTYPTPNGTEYGGYVAGSGTSFAAPFVTGAVGLLAAARPEITDRDAQEILRRSAHDVGAPGVDLETGHGRLDAARALHMVRDSIGIWHDEVAAVTFREAGRGTLLIGENGPGAFGTAAHGVPATLFEASVRVALPDSFADSVRVWPRAGGTFTVRGGFRLPYFAPWAEVMQNAGRSFVLRGYLYRLDDGSAEPVWLPLPPDQMRFGFTVLGEVRRVTPAPVIPPALHAAPNPFRDAVRFRTPAAGAIVVMDLAGRTVWRAHSRERTVTWNGRDAAGRPVPAGLYFARVGGGAPRAVRIVKLE